ncbi:unnamed protein product [Symbiodinium pilosum]|uniref:Uncharacterized protein n=1 Tax=Symbiodinium pilosum TaxID=2952 RepID=A0A812TZU0_SYMPI|nr:unnamed protein product [Symbiodinium pilosum]
MLQNTRGRTVFAFQPKRLPKDVDRLTFFKGSIVRKKSLGPTGLPEDDAEAQKVSQVEAESFEPPPRGVEAGLSRSVSVNDLRSRVQRHRSLDPALVKGPQSEGQEVSAARHCPPSPCRPLSARLAEAPPPLPAFPGSWKSEEASSSRAAPEGGQGASHFSDAGAGDQSAPRMAAAAGKALLRAAMEDPGNPAAGSAMRRSPSMPLPKRPMVPCEKRRPRPRTAGEEAQATECFSSQSDAKCPPPLPEWLNWAKDFGARAQSCKMQDLVLLLPLVGDCIADVPASPSQILDDAKFKQTLHTRQYKVGSRADMLAASVSCKPRSQKQQAFYSVGTKVLHWQPLCDGDEVPKHIGYAPRYFDFKAFRKALREKKESLSEAELREVRREYALPPPEGWTVLHFLEKMEFGDGAEDVANLFEHWKDFISMSAGDIMRIPDITAEQRRRLDKFITLFNHGLWPRVSADEFHQRFAGKLLENEGKPWTEEDDELLLQLAAPGEQGGYDASFGDPWVYISWEMQRREDDVQQRYLDLVVRGKERAARHELAITKASRPLHMHRRFRMIPPDVYIVPSQDNFPLAEQTFELPEAFKKYRQNDIF